MTQFTTIRLAESYLNAQLSGGHSGAARSAGPFVTVSRETGTGGLEFAEALARRLSGEPPARPWTVYSGNLIEEMLRTNTLPVQLARFLPEDSLSPIDASIGEIVGLHPDLWDLVAKTNDVIRRLARAGHAILVGRGANFATAGLPHGVHARLVAPPAFRAARAARLLALAPAAATTHNAQTDAARRRYVRATFEADAADPIAYDFVLNLARVPLVEAVEIVARAVAASQRSHAGSPGKSEVSNLR